MEYTPVDMLKYVLDHDLEASFLTAVSMHVGGYSIGEITDKVFEEKDGKFLFKSKAYGIDIELNDEDVYTAFRNGLYVSAFISRKDSEYQVHFLVHRYPISMKGDFEEAITAEVVQYMILKTIVALRLDNKEKIRKYCK